MTNKHDFSVVGVQTDVTSILSSVTGLGTSLSGVGSDVTGLLSGILGGSGVNLGVPSINVGSRVQGYKCTTANTETTLFVTSSPGFIWCQANSDVPWPAYATVRVYAGSIATENQVGHAHVYEGGSQVVCCYPAYSDNGFVVTVESDGTNPTCVAVSIYAAVPATATDYQSGIDGYMDGAFATTNHGSDNSFNVGKGTGTSIRNAIVEFDLSSVVAGSLVTQAILSLKVKNRTASDVTDFQVRACLQDFVEAEMTWNIYSTGNNWNVAGGQEGTDYGATIYFNGTVTEVAGDRLEMDITPLAKAWVDGTIANYGAWIFDATPASGVNVDFHSFNAASPGDRPLLTLSVV